MEFHVMELMCLSELIDKDALFGISLPDREIRPEEESLEYVMESLKKKRIVGQDGKLTKFGFVPLEALRQYKEAKKYLFMNQMRASFNADMSSTVIVPTETGFEILRQNRMVLMLSLLEKFEYLKKSQKKDQVPAVRKIAQSAWFEEMEEAQINQMLLIRKMNKLSLLPSVNIALYSNEASGWSYDFKTEMETETGARDMRAKLIHLLEIELEDWGEENAG